MKGISSWLPIFVAATLLVVAVVFFKFQPERTTALLSGPARVLEGWTESFFWTEPPPEAEPEAEARDTGGPILDLQYPTEKDWRFLLGILEKGTPEGRQSAARALVEIGQVRGVAPLFRHAGEGDEDAILFCLAALEILRLQKQEEALAEMVVALDASGHPLDRECRTEVSDRFEVAGGRDPEVVARLAEHASPAVRSFVAGFLLDVDPVGRAGVLWKLASDPDEHVRLRLRDWVPPDGAPGTNPAP